MGDDERVFVVAEIGINHNGSLEIAKQMIEGAAKAGADAVKFQKRTPERCVPRDQWDVVRDTPWGRMTYIEYRHRIELGKKEYDAIDALCEKLGIDWFASCWDEESVDFLEQYAPPCYKAASASLTDHPLLKRMKATGRPLIVSTGMSSMDEIEASITAIGTERLLVAHSTSLYPCPVDKLNLRMIGTLKARFPECAIGYSGHETGLATTLAAVAMGATHVERHVTLDRAMWGTDQAASVEMHGLGKLVEGIRDLERAFGDGVKAVHEGEIKQRNKLRRVATIAAHPHNGAGAPPSSNGANGSNGKSHPRHGEAS